MNSTIEILNDLGGRFLSFAWPMLWQSSLLIVVLFAMDFLLRRRIRASIRYALWLVVLVKLCLPPTLALPTSPVWWLPGTRPPAPPPVHYTVTYGTQLLPEISQNPAPVYVAPAPVMTRAAWLLLGSGFISVLLLALLLVRWRQVAKRVRFSNVSERLTAIQNETRKLAGVTSASPARLAPNTSSPAICGLFRPAILIPQSLAEKFSDEQLRAVLLHEMVHLRRRDVWLNCLQALLQIVYWWHPLLWLANARVRHVREEAVDDAVMLALRDKSETYAPTLLEVAKLALNRPLASLGLVGILESRSALRQRIERLVNFRAPRKAGLTLISLLGIAAFTAIAVPMGSAPPQTSHSIVQLESNGQSADKPTSVNGGNSPSAMAALIGDVIFPHGRSAPATVLVVAARQKAGTPIIARYPDLPIHTQSDSKGHFKIESLDPAWLYHVMIIAPGCRPKSLNKVDLDSGPLEVRLEAVDPNSAPAGTVLRGRVLDSHGRPIRGALIRIQEVTRGRWTHFDVEKIDEFAASDEAGNFVVYGKTAFADAGGAVEAPDFATGLFEGWAPGENIHELTLVEGASLQGRLLHGGKPVPNAKVQLDHFGAESGSWIWRYTAVSDNQGRFIFTHLPPDRYCRLHGLMGSLGDLGAVPTLTVQIPGNGQTNDIGSLNLDPVYNVTGRILLTDNKAVPKDSFVYAWMPIPVNNDGVFHLIGVPAGTLYLALRIPGYELSPMDLFLKSGSATNITVHGNIRNLVIKMEPTVAGMFQAAMRASTVSERRLSASQFDTRLGTNAVYYLKLFRLHFPGSASTKSNVAAIISILESNANANPSGTVPGQPVEPARLHQRSQTIVKPEPMNAATRVGSLLADGKQLYEMGRFDEAEKSLKSALALEPEDQVAHHYMTLVQSAKSARREGIVQAQAGRRRIIDELDRIRVDHFGPNDRWPLAQVVSKLNQLTAGLVSNSPDIHFFTTENADGLQPMINPNTGLLVRNAVTNGAEINSVLVSIDPPLKNVTLAEVLDTVVFHASKPIQYSVSAKGILFSPKNNFQPPRLFSRTFNVRTDVFLANLQKQTGSETNVAAALRQLFLTSGLDLTSPESVFYNNRLGLLFVRASEKDLTAAEKIVVQLNDNQLAPQIHIKARFVEVSKGTLDGFSRMFGVTNQTNDVGIMTAENAKLAMRALQSRSGFEELAAPQVTTISARQTEMRATRSIMDITNFAFKETSAGSEVFPQTNVVETGPILDTIAIISPDGYQIDLKATASLTHFLGCDNTTNITVVYDKEGQKISLPTISPCFDIRRASAHVKLWDGQTLVLGLKNHFCDAGKEVGAEPDYFVKTDRNRGWPIEEDKKVLVFITATLVDPAGHRIHSDSGENAIPPQNGP